MTITSPSITPATATQWARWAAWAAFAWAALFAAVSFLWAAGGRTGIHPFEQLLVGSVWLRLAITVPTGLAKLGAGVAAVALVRVGARDRWYRPLLAFAWLAGVGMLLYGGVGLISDILHVTGVVHVPAADRFWFFWYLVVWDPVFVVGGALFVATAWLTWRATGRGLRG
jgi:hypothetical protein